MMSSQDFSTESGNNDGLDAVLPGGYQPSSGQAPAEQQVTVDQVALRKLGGFNFITPLQWIAIERDERMRLIKSEAVVFLSEGDEVPLRSALQYLKDLSDGLPQGPPPQAPPPQASPAFQPAPPPEAAPPQAAPSADEPGQNWPPPSSRPPSIVEEPLDPAIRPRERPDHRGD